MNFKEQARAVQLLRAMAKQSAELRKIVESFKVGEPLPDDGVALAAAVGRLSYWADATELFLRLSSPSAVSREPV